jgi:hypothetical protein
MSTALDQLNRTLRCFACDTAIEVAAGDRVGFRDSCDRCRADLHVCRNCELRDPGAQNECREPNAEWVSDRERGNHCEYFTPSDRGGGEQAQAAADAKSQLDVLFKK